jgi:hypothetical protein
MEAYRWNSNLHTLQAGLANRLTLRAFDVAPTTNCVGHRPKRASRCRLGMSGLAGFVQAVQSPTAGQTVVDSEVPKEEVRESLHRYESKGGVITIPACTLCPWIKSLEPPEQLPLRSLRSIGNAATWSGSGPISVIQLCLT